MSTVHLLWGSHTMPFDNMQDCSNQCIVLHPDLCIAAAIVNLDNYFPECSHKRLRVFTEDIFIAVLLLLE